MAAVMSHNPSFEDYEDQSGAAKRSAIRLSPEDSATFNSDVYNRSRNRSIATAAAVALVGAAAMAVGVLIGGNNSSSTPVTETGTGTATGVIPNPTSVLAGMYIDQPSLASIKPQDLNALVTQYENTHSPNQWANNFVPEQFVAEWSKIRNDNPAEEVEDEAARDAAEADPDAERRLREEERRLIGEYPRELVVAAHDSTFAARVDPIIFENDAAGVEKKGFRCVISFDTSNDAADWDDNGLSGNGPLFSVNEYTEAGPACPLGSCTDKRILGQGANAFRMAWNGFNTRVWERMTTVCATGVTEYVFTGWSRGGAIASIASASLLLEGLLPATEIKLVTFGAPLAVSPSLSDSVHNVFEQYRFVYRSDPVSASPPAATGGRHFGEMRCIRCRRGREGRDLPAYANFFAFFDHLGYTNWNP